MYTFLVLFRKRTDNKEELYAVLVKAFDADEAIKKVMDSIPVPNEIIEMEGITLADGMGDDLATGNTVGRPKFIYPIVHQSPWLIIRES